VIGREGSEVRLTRGDAHIAPRTADYRPETMVRMGELTVSETPGDVLVSIGLASCTDLATRDALRQSGISVAKTATGGDKGRTIRVHVERGVVACKEAGGPEVELYRGVA
jgi:chemotaxis receptor (MCP) glutamine deamidase CheD